MPGYELPLSTSNTDQSAPERTTTEDILQEGPSHGQAITLPGSLAGVAWSLDGSAILCSSDGLIFNVLV